METIDSKNASYHEISPTKSSLRLMRQISGLGMEDPVFGSGMEKIGMASFTSTSLPPMMDLFDDMGFDDLPKDMRDAVSVASDPTAAYSLHKSLLLQNESDDEEEEKRESPASYSRKHPSNKDRDDATTCSLTKDTLLAEAAQALEGRVSSSLLNVARHQLKPQHPRTNPQGSIRMSQSKLNSDQQHRIMPTMDNIFPMS